MKKPESILVILDKPKHDQRALERALEVAGETGAHLHLASFCWLPMVNRSDVFDTHQRRAIKKSAMHERRRWLDALVLDRGLSGADVDTEVVWTDDIAAWVQEDVTAHGRDLVVKSVHNSRTLIHTPLDWMLLRSCPAPLLLVSTRDHTPTGRVLATVDVRGTDPRHSRLNRRVIDAAARFTELMGGKLHCVNALDMVASFTDLPYVDDRKMRSEARQASRQRLEHLVSRYDVAKSRMHVPLGKVGHVVAETAEKIDADLVVVGTGTRRGIGAALLGSSAEKILGRLSCDVLAVHV